MSAKDYTDPEITDGFVDVALLSLSMSLNSSVLISIKTMPPAINPASDASGMGFDATGADGPNFDWDSESIKNTLRSTLMDEIFC